MVFSIVLRVRYGDWCRIDINRVDRRSAFVRVVSTARVVVRVLSVFVVDTDYITVNAMSVPACHVEMRTVLSVLDTYVGTVVLLSMLY